MKYPRLIFFLFLILLNSCSSFKKEEFEIKKITGSPSFYLPLATGDLTINDVIKKMKQKDVTMETDANGLLTLNYVESKRSFPASTFITLPDYDFERTTDFPGATLPPNSGEKELSHISEIMTFSGFAPKLLKEIKFKNTTLSVNLNGNVIDGGLEGIEVELKIPNLIKDGKPFTHRQPFGSQIQAFSLNDYVMTLDNHSFTCEIALIEKIHTREVTYPWIILSTRVRFKSIEFSYLKGYLGDYGIPIPNLEYTVQSTSGKIKEGEFTVKDPEFEVRIYNGFGAPMDLSFDKLEVEDHQKNMTALQMDSPLPVVLRSSTGLDKPSALTIVKATNAKEAFGKKPKRLFFFSYAHMNRAKEPGDNFCADTSTVGWRFRLTYPLEGKAQKSYLRDTVKIDLSKVVVEDVQEAALMLNMVNKYPIDVNIQIYLSDRGGDNFEKLLNANNQLVKSSEVNSKGEYTAAGVANKEIPIDGEVLKKMTRAKKIIFEAEFATGHLPKDVQFKADQGVKVQLGLKTTLRGSYVSK